MPYEDYGGNDCGRGGCTYGPAAVEGVSFTFCYVLIVEKRGRGDVRKAASSV